MKYELVGIVAFIPPYSVSPSGQLLAAESNNSKHHMAYIAVGHYTAICPRPGNRWTEFDDLKNGYQQGNYSFLGHPSLLIFKKQ